VLTVTAGESASNSNAIMLCSSSCVDDVMSVSHMAQHQRQVCQLVALTGKVAIYHCQLVIHVNYHNLQFTHPGHIQSGPNKSGVCFFWTTL